MTDIREHEQGQKVDQRKGELTRLRVQFTMLRLSLNRIRNLKKRIFYTLLLKGLSNPMCTQEFKEVKCGIYWTGGREG
jgi:hypothetical protein